MYIITGKFQNNADYQAFIADEDYTAYQQSKHLVSFDGVILDLNSLQEQFVDNDGIKDAERSRLMIALDDDGSLELAEATAEAIGGATKQWFKNARTFSYYDARVQAFPALMGKDIAWLTQIFKAANAIE